MGRHGGCPVSFATMTVPDALVMLGTALIDATDDLRPGATISIMRHRDGSRTVIAPDTRILRAIEAVRAAEAAAEEAA